MARSATRAWNGVVGLHQAAAGAHDEARTQDGEHAPDASANTPMRLRRPDPSHSAPRVHDESNCTPAVEHTHTDDVSSITAWTLFTGQRDRRDRRGAIANATTRQQRVSAPTRDDNFP